MEHYKVKAFYLEPGKPVDKSDEGAGIVAVDGERIPYGPVAVEIFRGLMNIICLE